MLWFTCRVLCRFRLFAPIALLSSLEIIVLTFWALPTTLRELKVPFRFLESWFFSQLIRRLVRRRCTYFRWCHNRRLRLLTISLYRRLILQWRLILNLKINPVHVLLQLVQINRATLIIVFRGVLLWLDRVRGRDGLACVARRVIFVVLRNLFFRLWLLVLILFFAN